MTDEEETKEINREIEATDPGFGNEPLKDPGRGRTTGNYIGNLLPIRPLAKQSILAYGTPGAFNDDSDDFLKLRAADLYPRAKELALGIQGSLRPGLRDDRSLANKLYLTYKNVPETTIARMNLAFTSTAAVADIRRAIAFATKTSRPAKASKAYASSSEPHDHICSYNTLKADSDLDEEYECFIQDRQYFEGKKAAKATTKGFVTTYGTFDADERSPRRFSIKLKDDTDFNNTVYVNVMHLDGKNVLHVVCDSTNFQAAIFFKSISAQHLLKGFNRCWVNTYVGPFTNVVHDPGTNFNSATFRSYLKSISSILKQMLVEAYHSVGLVERYHVFMRRAFEIVTKELPKALKEDRLQMAIKAINDTAGPNGLVLTLFVFSTLPKLTEQDRLAAST
ncbi:hypothetical protein MBM_02073 [Drepanopeziza brunnea f. sp. 'multigermtubi' MB_m1]|uniref:Integrase catalytic domain-containing protein n=1 Tax=Marssonina brunnea f. sp. multigermtubi (strain MB_m1) TaxID=1072389 RepID=K1X4N9_MARBU|nr:uncharacterized protein MBM_02073 [Drepanopeziza brunnea f. sp. 'multigermtubi' MB_m1]EKD20121.1 hypothetical protein MBM_02073 [Drepanopeziza brunnea f. sp. 'multigermtubi' MB_m1]